MGCILHHNVFNESPRELERYIMNTAATLRRLAIQAAKAGDWQAAVEKNQQILNFYPEDTNALNRIGVAYIQLNEFPKSKKAFKHSLEIDKANTIARKHLDRLDNNQVVAAPSFIKQHFIEEPGKTKTIVLHRLANKQILETVTIGTPCELKLKNRYISVTVNGTYIGALPEDVSFRLTKLMENGNEYECFVKSCDGKNCVAYLKEVKQSQVNAGIQSFPGNKANMMQSSDFTDLPMLEEDIPMEIVDTDTDSERSIDDVDQQDLE